MKMKRYSKDAQFCAYYGSGFASTQNNDELAKHSVKEVKATLRSAKDNSSVPGSWNGGKCSVQGVETAQKVSRRAGIEIPIVNLTGLSLTAHCSGWGGPIGLVFGNDLA